MHIELNRLSSRSVKRKSSGEWILIVVGLFFILSVILTFNSFKLIFTGIETEGIVMGVEQNISTDSDGYTSYTYRPTVEYTCNGNHEIQHTKHYSSSYNYHTGAKITIYCDQYDSSQFIPKEITNYLCLLFPIVGLIVLIIGISGLIKSIKRKQLKGKLLNQGYKISATVEDIEDSGVLVNNQRGYRIIATDKGGVYESENIFADIYRLVDKGDKIDVYLDVNNHSIYRMDTDSIFDRPIKEHYTSSAESNGSIINA